MKAPPEVDVFRNVVPASRRFVRGTDKLFELSEHLRTSARVANGVYLRLAFNDGSVTSDVVVPELLHIGSLTTGGLIALDSEKVAEAMRQMKVLVEAIKPDSGAETVENRYLYLEDVRTATKKLLSVFHPLDPQYEKDALRWQKEALNVSDVDPLLSFAKRLKGSLEEAKNYESDRKPSLAEAEKHTLGGVFNFLKLVEDSAVVFEKRIDDIRSVKRLHLAFPLIYELVNEYEMRKKFPPSLIELEPKERTVKNIKLCSESSQVFRNATDQLAMIAQLVAFRRRGATGEEQHTAAFPKGGLDLRALSNDAERGMLWKTAGASTVAAQKLKTDLNPLDELGKKLEAVEQDLKAAEAKVSGLDSTIAVQMTMGEIPNSWANASVRGDMIVVCEGNFKSGHAPGVDSILPLYEAVKKLDEKLSNLSTFRYIGELTDLGSLKSIVDLSRFRTDEEKTEATPGIVKQLKETLKNGSLIQTLERAQTDLPILQSVAPQLSDLLRGITDNLNTFEPYRQELEKTSDIAFYRCLNDIGDGDELKTLIGTMKSLRGIGSDLVSEDVVKGVDGILKSKETMKTLVSSASGLKQSPLGRLKALADKQNTARRLGRAAQGLMRIIEMNESRKALSPLMANVSFVRTAADTQKSQLQPHDYTHLLKLEDLKTSLEACFQNIDAFRRKVDLWEMESPDSLKSTLAEANSLSGVDGDVTALRKGVDALLVADPSLHTQLANIRAALDTLGSLELQLPRFEIHSAGGSLDSLNEFLFARARAEESALFFPAPLRPRTSPQAPAVRLQQLCDTKKTPSGLLLSVVGLSVFSAIALFGTFALVYYYCIPKKKEGEREEAAR